MTRINLVPPQTLSDKHLMAEYRELPRIFTAVRKLYDQGKTLADVDIPQQYVLGKGHCKFFYRRLWWLERRLILIRKELVRRGVNINESLFASILTDSARLCGLRNARPFLVHYTPTNEEIYLNMARLVKRGKFDRATEEINNKE